MDRHPRTNRIIVKRNKFNKAQVVFIKYLDAYELYADIKKQRIRLRINEYGFSTASEIRAWLEREGQYDLFEKRCLQFLVKNDLPHDHYSLLKDYVLTGFRFTLFAKDEDSGLCILQDPGRHHKTPYFILKVHDGATPEYVQQFVKSKKKEIEKILKQKRKISVGTNITSPRVHNRNLIVRSYKGMSKRDLVEQYFFDPEEIKQMKVTDKMIVVQRLMKKRHNVRMTRESIDKV